MASLDQKMSALTAGNFALADSLRKVFGPADTGSGAPRAKSTPGLEVTPNMN